MRLLGAVVLVTAWLGAGTASAQPALTPCVLTGVYSLVAALSLDGNDGQMSGQFTFTPPSGCAAGTFGTAQVTLSVLLSGDPTPGSFGGSFPYTVDGAGQVAIGSGLIRGRVAAVSDTGIANSLRFEGDPGLPLATRFAGTAGRVSLAPDAVAVYDAVGTQVGKVVSLQPATGTPDVLLRIAGQVFTLSVSPTRFRGPFMGTVLPPGPLFTSVDCSGPPLVLASSATLLPLPVVAGPGLVVYLPDRTASPSTVTVNSALNSETGACDTAGPAMASVQPALPPIDLSSVFTPPFTLR